MKNTLIPMTQFVLHIDEIFPKETGQDISSYWLHKFLSIENYAKFLSQPLTLGIFVPCNEAGEVLNEPEPPHTWASENAVEYREIYEQEKAAYQAAKERVLFEGFEYHKYNDGKWLVRNSFLKLYDIELNNSSVEYLVLKSAVGVPLFLTTCALKQIGINEIPEVK